MIKVEKVILDDSQIVGLWILDTLNNWKEDDNYSDLPSGVYIDEDDIEKQLNNTYMKLTFSNDFYFKIPKFRGKQIQFLLSRGGNNPEREISCYHNKPHELYISQNKQNAIK